MRKFIAGGYEFILNEKDREFQIKNVLPEDEKYVEATCQLIAADIFLEDALLYGVKHIKVNGKQIPLVVDDSLLEDIMYDNMDKGALIKEVSL